ncbi:MAG: C40 family peptidase [Lachnoclostridium sp.]|nr:C40 family peptidase [Lachnoclostridium sp.]
MTYLHKSLHRSVIAICSLTLVILTSCGASRTVTASSSKSKRSVEYVSIEKGTDPSSNALLSEAKKWLGVPYKYGGTDHNGVDCSALVLNVYRDALNIKLPRSSRQQFDFSKGISKSELIPGDLLFFATTKGRSDVSHVGMYIGDGKMVHSSASQGVMVSRITEDYFVRTFAGAGRIESYYAMVNKKRKKDKKSDKATDQELLPPSQPFKFEPVASIPSKKTPETPEAIATAIVTGSPEISAEEARMQVLDNLIEQKIDSIYSAVK